MAQKETKKTPLTEQERKNYIILAVAMIVVLSIISLVTRNQKFTQPPVTAGNKNSTTVISDLGTPTDLKASALIQKEIFDPAVINQEVNKEFGTDQTVIIPAIADSELKAKANSQQNVASYLEALDTKVQNYNYKTQDITKNLFTDAVTASALDDARGATTQLVKDLYAMPVPKDAFKFHKAVINTYVSYGALIKLAKDYNLGIIKLPSKDIYGQYLVINSLGGVMDLETQALLTKYKIQIKQ